MWPFRRKKRRNADIMEFADMLAAIDLPENYRSSDQRYYDFRAVFINGTARPDQCRRVLCQVFRWCGLFRPVRIEHDPYATHARAGAQEVGQRIMTALNTIPKSATDEEDENG